MVSGCAWVQGVSSKVLSYLVELWEGQVFWNEIRQIIWDWMEGNALLFEK